MHKLPVPEILEEMASTFRARNKVYGDNYKMVGRVMAVLFPNGVKLTTAKSYDKWHLFELQIVKLTRFAISNLTHKDSVHDLSVYGAMIEALIQEDENEQNRNHRKLQRTGRRAGPRTEPRRAPDPALRPQHRAGRAAAKKRLG